MQSFRLALQLYLSARGLNQLFFAQPTISFFHEMLKTIILSVVVGQHRIYPCHIHMHLLIYRPMYIYSNVCMAEGCPRYIDDWWYNLTWTMIWRAFCSCKLYWRLHQRIRSCHMGTIYFCCADLPGKPVEHAREEVWISFMHWSYAHIPIYPSIQSSPFQSIQTYANVKVDGHWYFSQWQW